MTLKAIAVPVGSDLEAMDDLTKVVNSIMRHAIVISSVVYLKRECAQCVSRELAERFPEYLNKVGGAEGMMKDFDQSMRQLVIWTMAESEEFLKQPCSKATD
jgi:hypothetical protein